MTRTSPVLAASLALLASCGASRSVAQCASEWSAVGSSPDGTNSYVYALQNWDPDGPGSQPPLLVAGGQFTEAGGVAVNQIATWDGTTWSTLGAGFDRTVRSLAVLNDQLYAAGEFTTTGGVTANRVARWTGSNWQPLGSGMDGAVHVLAEYNGELIAGGVTANRIARWDGSAWRPLGSGIENP